MKDYDPLVVLETYGSSWLLPLSSAMVVFRALTTAEPISWDWNTKMWKIEESRRLSNDGICSLKAISGTQLAQLRLEE